MALAVLAPWATAEPVGIAYAWRFGEVSLNTAGRGPITLWSNLSDDGSTLTVNHGNGSVQLSLAAPGWWADPSTTTSTGAPTTPEPSALVLSLGLLAGSAALRRRLSRA
ncbi:MAG: hypothetical protein U0797_30575 [Gemmataceae bacterium]